MLLSTLWSSLEESSIAMRIGESWWFPLLESLHVIAITLVVGSLLMVDLRLMGAAAKSYPVSRISREQLPWTWVAFVIAVITGLGLFITRANHYIENPAFQIKLLLIALAGINMLVLHFLTFRKIASWDTQVPPIGAKFSGMLSLIIWFGVILAGRWTGHLS